MSIEVLQNSVYLGTAAPSSGGQEINNQDITITSNGTYTADEGYTGIGTATVALPLGTKAIIQNGTYMASNDSLEGYSKVAVNVPNPSTGTLSITNNGVYNVTNYASADVNVSSGDTITATNKTGADIASGDKVFINGSTGNYRLDRYYVPGNYYENFYNNGTTINETTGVVSGFSSSAYILITPLLPLTGLKKMVFNGIYSTTTAVQTLLGKADGTNVCFYISESNNSSPSRFCWYDSTNNDNLVGTTQLSDNTQYWFGALFDYSTLALTMYLAVDDGTYTKDTLPDFSNTSFWSVEASGTLSRDPLFNNYYIGYNSNTQTYWHNNIDLSKFYIQINGLDWWVPAYKYSFQKALSPTITTPKWSYTVSSSQYPTIDTNFVASKFSENKALYCSSRMSNFNLAHSTLCTKFNLSNYVGSSAQSLFSGGYVLSIGSSGKIMTWRGMDNYWYVICSYSANTWYWLELKNDGTNYKLSVSTDGVNYTDYTWTDYSPAESDGFWMTFGYSYWTSGQALNQNVMIDLDNTYIKNADGVVVWRAVEKVVNTPISSNTLMGYATENIANGSSGSVSTVLDGSAYYTYTQVQSNVNPSVAGHYEKTVTWTYDTTGATYNSTKDYWSLDAVFSGAAPTLAEYDVANVTINDAQVTMGYGGRIYEVDTISLSQSGSLVEFDCTGKLYGSKNPPATINMTAVVKYTLG